VHTVDRRRHQRSVLCVCRARLNSGELLISLSADATLRIWTPARQSPTTQVPDARARSAVWGFG
jgi:hypothetical protein